MSLETIVNKMIAANEPESNIAKVIKYHKKDSSKINCKKCNHSWKVADGGDDLYMCHECGYNNNKSPLKAIKCPEGFIDNEDGLGCVEEVDIEAAKRNKLDKNYAREMSSQAPEVFEAKDNTVSNTREEILERRKKCPEGFEKVDGKCVEKGIIATEQLEDVEIVADKVDPEVKKVAKEQAYEYNIENTTLGRVNDKARNYKPTEEDINNFVATSVDYRQQQQNFKAENKSTIFNRRLKETIDGLLEKAELFDPAGKDPKIVEANKKAEQASGTYVDPTGILEAREVYLKTGEWPFSKQQAAELNKKVDLDLEEAQEEFDSKIPESVKKYNESAEYNSPEAKQEREEVKQNEMFNEMVVKRLRSGAKNNETVQQTYQNLVDEDEGGKKVKERYQQNPEVQEILNVKRKELQEKFNIKQAYQDVYKTVQSEEKDRINKFADKAYRDVKIGYVNSDGSMVATVPTKGIQWEDRKKEADDKINLYIQQLAEKSIQNNPTIAGYNDAMTVFNQEQFQNFASQDTEYLEGINKYKTALERGVNIVNSEKEAKVREINIEALSRTTNIPKEVLPAVASVSSFVFTQGAGLVDFAEKFGYAPLAAIMKTTGFMGSSPNGLSLSENFENIARENNVDLSEVYKAADALATLKPKYYDKDGIPQDGLDLALSGDYKKAAEVLVNEAIGSGPSLALSIAFPVAGSLMLGMSTAGSGLEDDLVRRPKETLEKIYSANLLKGTFETGMEYLGAKSFRLINSMKTAGKSAQQVREMMNPIINLGVKSTLAGLGEGLTESLTNVGQEGTDWLVYDDEKEFDSVLHNSINAGLVGFILGKGATAVSVGSQISEQKSLAFQALAPLQWKGEMRKIEEQIVEEQGSLDENSSKVKRERVESNIEQLKLQKKYKLEELTAQFDSLSKGELLTYAKNEDIKNDLNAIVNSENDKYTENQKERANEERKEVAESNRQLVSPDFYDKGIEDVVSKEFATIDALSALETLNKKQKKYVDYEKGKKIGPDGDSYTRNVAYIDTVEEMQEIGEGLNKENWGESDAEYIYNTETKTVDIYVNKTRSALTGQLNALGHELFHDFVTMNFNRDEKGMKPLVDSFKTYLKEENSDIYDRIENRINSRYDVDENGELPKGSSEEWLNIFTDIAAKEKIEIKNGSPNLIKNLGNSIEGYLQGYGFGSVQLNTGEEVFNFLKNYSKNINKGRFKVLDIKAQSDLVQSATKNVKGFEAPSRSEINKSFVNKSKELKNSLDNKEITQTEYDSQYKIAKKGFDDQIKNLVEQTDNEIEYNKLQELYEKSLDEDGNLIQTELGKNRFQLGINKIAAPIFESITKRLYDPTPKDLLDEYSRANFINDLRSASYEMIAGKEGSKEKFDPTAQTLDKYLSNRLNLRANRIIDKATGKDNQFTEDLTSNEAQAVSSDQQVNSDINLNKPIVKSLNLEKLDKKSEKLVEGFLNNITISDAVKNKLKDPKLSDKRKINILRKSLGNLFSKQLKDEISKELGKNTKTSNDLSKYLDKNYDSLVNAALNNIDFQMGSGISSSWSFDNMPTKQEFIDYYEGKDILPSQPRSVKADRKKSLVNAVAKQISNEALIDFAKKDPATAQLFNKENNISFASRSITKYDLKQSNGKDFIRNLNSLPGWNSNSANPAAKVPAEILRKIGGPIDFTTEEGINRFWDILDKIDSKKLFKKIFTKTGLRPGGADMFSSGKAPKRKKGQKDRGTDDQYKEWKKRDDLFETRRKKFLNQEFAEFVGDAKGWTARKYGDYFGRTEKEIAKNWYKKTEFNKSNKAMFEQTWQSFYDIIETNPEFAAVVNHMAQTDMGATSWMRLGAELLAYSTNPKGVKDKNGKIKYYEWEHAMQANNVKLILLEGAVKGVKFNRIFPPVVNNFKLIALDKAVDGVLGASGRKNSMGENFDFISSSWTQRYFDADVALYGGIDPNSMTTGEQTLGKLYNIDEAGQPVVEPITTLKPIKKARIFDFDDTLAKTKSNVLYSLPDGTNGTLDATQFAEQFKKLQDAGAEFDYSEFSKVVNGSKGPLADVAKKINNSKGDRDVFVLTARPADANIAIQEFLKETLNINIPLENITGLADGKPSAKADWISGKVSEGYNDIFFADDVAANVKAVSDVLNKLGVIKKVQVAKDNEISLSSKTFYEDSEGISEIQSPLSQEFNKMLENTKGVKAEAKYSEARAAKMGGKTGFQAFVPYSAEDFLGLVYPTLGKGEQGNKDLKWWKDNVMNPYNDGMTLFESSKQASMLEWQQIKEQIKNTPTNLGKEAVRDFSNEDAIRVYLWNQQDATPSDLSKKDVKALVDYVKNNAELRDFANQINSLNVNGYPDPTKGWLAGTITTDLVNHVNTSTRSEMLAPWQQAIDEIYTNDNKNKLKATYGDKYIEALDDVLYRMKTGRNRPSGANRITNNWLNWVNDSVGTIMFFNQRSAILQTISSINFINLSDNNPIAAAKAFGNQKQYWSDFSYLFNSDYLKQRRSGLKTDVNADEIAQQAAGSTNKVRAGLSWLLKKGFLPTQIADSFAIASGGSTFYRNRVSSLVKSGMSKVDAEKQAFADFRESANDSQQSSDPSKVSMEQASSLGRVILAFANTPIQYTRLTKRATQDLLAGRGDWKTNVSKIVYYGAVQNIIFTTLQQAMFGMLFSDDDDEFQNKKKDTAVFNVANSTVDTFLRGSGVAGAFVAMLKNMALEIKRQKDSKRPDYTKVADKLFTVSPPIDSKFRKLKSAGRAFTYKQELEKMKNKGLALDNPAFMAIAQVISAFGNIPADRVLRKLNNIVEATNSKNAIWQRIGLAMGWGEWELGITDRKTKEAKEERDSFKALEKSITRATKAIAKEKAKEAKKAKKKTPIKALEAGVLGEANRDGSIVVAKGLSKEKRKEVIRHEKVHQKEISSGKLDYDDKFVYYGKKKYERKNGSIMHNGKAKIEGDHSLPWEKVAHKH